MQRELKIRLMTPMRSRCTVLARAVIVSCALATLFVLTCCTKRSSPQTSSVDLRLEVKAPFRFVAYGDTRFHDPSDFEAANPPVRVALVHAIADADPAFVCFTGDIVYNGNDGSDWKVWDSETSIWRDKKIPIYPALGNHDLHGDPSVAPRQLLSAFPRFKEQPLLLSACSEYARAGARQFTG